MKKSFNVIFRLSESGVQGSRRRGVRSHKRGLPGHGSESERPGIERGRSRDHRIRESVRRGAELSVLRTDVTVPAAIGLTHGRQQSTSHRDRRSPSTERSAVRR